MEGFRDNQVINGTFGELWVDGEYMSEIISFEAKITLETADINQIRRLTTGKKIIGMSGSGTMKLHKVTSRFIKLMSDNMKSGKQTICTIISKVSDPDSLGAERVVIKDCTFTELSLANWESKKTGEESVPFSFTDWDILDIIE